MAFGLETGAKLFDKSRHRAHGDITGADWAAGAHGYALDFTATVPDYVEIAAAYDHLNFISGPFSIIARIKLDSISGYPKLFNRSLYAVDGYILQISNDASLNFNTSQSGVAQSTSSAAATIAVATWYTVGMSRTGAAAKVYINGVDATSAAETHQNPATCARSAKIGVYDNKVDDGVDGKIEFLRIFSLALSAKEHLAYHNALA